jgi:uncharacterized protein YicC (UPF0701 family)
MSGYGVGDHYINIRIKPPKHLTNKQKALLQVLKHFLSRGPVGVIRMEVNKIYTNNIAIYGPMINTAPYVMFLMRADPLRGQMRGG